MAKHIWSVLCTKTSIDRETNNISIFDVIERLTVAGIPQGVNVVLPIQAELAILWMRSEYDKPDTGIGRFKLVAPDNAVLGGGQFDINLADPHIIRTRNIIRMNSLPLRGPGIYSFIIEHQLPENDMWETVSSVPLEVLYSEAPS